MAFREPAVGASREAAAWRLAPELGSPTSLSPVGNHGGPRYRRQRLVGALQSVRFGANPGGTAVNFDVIVPGVNVSLLGRFALSPPRGTRPAPAQSNKRQLFGDKRSRNQEDDQNFRRDPPPGGPAARRLHQFQRAHRDRPDPGPAEDRRDRAAGDRGRVSPTTKAKPGSW